MNNNLLRVRVTGVLIEDGSILLVKQKVSSDRNWSLPGGKVEVGESLENALLREMSEETGLEIKIKKLLYVCDLPEATPSLVHITFLLEKVSGEIRMPTNEYETTQIYDVKMVPIQDLIDYGFSETFIKIVESGFQDAGSYQGHKRNIGL
ncbi:NUDIX hydrolase [Paenibacillus eucommiae]|uniref:NUDIX hydrolase n=1 Tax=Paenibacillus eucommiae TaxID=1355755 RepID=UPI001AE3A4AA|nr:NUDIX hydrolase [Paenibacillus eucommiae]